MNYTFKMIRRVAGKNIKSLYLPIVLSCLDALLHMGMFSTMVLTIIELIGGIFTRSYPQPESWIFQQEQHRPPHEYADYRYY